MWLTNAVRNFWRKRRTETELDDEVREYVEMLAEEKIRSGLNARQAYREAKMELGGVEQVKEQTREVRAGHFLETLWQDVRYGARMLRRSPGFTIVAVLTLALGIGANTAIFSVINSVLFKPLPVEAPQELVDVYNTPPKNEAILQYIPLSYPDYADYRDQSRSLLRKNPSFTIVAVLTLALGIGANTAIFSVIESVMFRPLPFARPDQIVRVYETLEDHRVGGDAGGPSPMDMRDFAQNNRTFENMVVYDTWRKNVSFADNQTDPEQMWVGLVPGAYFEILDVKPIMGRLFTDDESYVGKHYVAAISTRVWKTRYGGDLAILGRKILINGEPYTIIAVMPDVIPEWMDSRDVQIWTPLKFADLSGDQWTEVGRRGRGWYSLGRIKLGVS